MLADAEGALGELLEAGWCLVVDDWERLDRWSRSLLERVRPRGAVLGSRLGGAGAEVALAPLTVSDLAPVFAGPDRLLHLREDGARELHQRTGGLQVRVAAELSAWVHRGMARWEGGRLALDPAALARSQMGLGQEQVQHHADAGPALSEPLHALLAWVALGWPHTTEALLASASGHPPWQLALELQELGDRGAVHRLADGRIQPLVAATALQDWLGARRREAHLAIAAALPSGAEGRLLHLIAAGDTTQVGHEAERLAEDLIQRGRLRHAMAVLDEALFVVRRATEATLLARLLTLRALAALLSQDAHVLRAAVLALHRDRDQVPQALPLLGGALAFMRGRHERAGELLEALTPLADPRLEAYRQALLFHLAARAGDLEGGLARLRRALGGTSHPFAAARLASMEGWAAYWRQDFVGAARDFGRSAGLAWAQSSRVLGLTKAASALIEAGELEEAASLAEEAVALAAEHRLSVAEGRAEWCYRSACYRLGRPAEPAPELLVALRRLENDHLLGTTALVEAASAFRRGERGSVLDLAGEAREAFEREGFVTGALLAEGLAVACGPADSGRAADLARRAEAARPEPVRLQVFGLAALGAGEGHGIRAHARALAEALQLAGDPVRREVLSPRECAEGL